MLRRVRVLCYFGIQSFWGKWENAQNRAEKYDGALIWRVIMTKRPNIWKPENKLEHEG